MEIGVIGPPGRVAEVEAKFGNGHAYRAVDSRSASSILIRSEVIFDLDNEEVTAVYPAAFHAPVFLDTSFNSLRERLKESVNRPAICFGVCGFPTFLNRPLLEVSLGGSSTETQLRHHCEKLKTDFQLVEDRPGMVTPRVICMIINEAYFTAEEGTATRADIDQAMKLGTNYPWGPFEWCKRIGASHVVALLDAVYRDTKDERYLVCKMLRSEAV